MIEAFNEAMTKKRKGKNNDEIIEGVRKICREFSRGIQELKNCSLDILLTALKPHTGKEQDTSDTSFPGSTAWNTLTAAAFADKYEKVEIIKNMKMPTKGETPAQIKRETLWREYWKEKQRMPNNERRRKGLPMVRRPKRQQWIGRSKTEKKGRCAKCNRKTRNRKKHS
jgi:hypothetical protein